jgi:hypothetical protein
MKTENLLLFAGRREDFPSRKAHITAAAVALARLAAIWDKIEMVLGGTVQPVLEKMHLRLCVELRRQRRSKPGGRTMSLRREHYNMTAMLEDGTRTKKPKNLTVHAPARLMPTGSLIGVLGGNQIINSWAQRNKSWR